MKTASMNYLLRLYEGIEYGFCPFTDDSMDVFIRLPDMDLLGRLYVYIRYTTGSLAENGKNYQNKLAALPEDFFVRVTVKL